MKDHTINYIEFTAPDLEKIKAFYTKVFKWKFTDYGPEYSAFNDGFIDGGFEKGEVKNTGQPLVILYSSNLEDTQKAVAAAGGKIVRGIFSFPGGRRFHFTDPSGNELAVWSDK
jgi:predicted enzyme related to lactoylglutathione lyase